MVKISIMAKISKHFLETYGKALNMTLAEYMASKPTLANEGRAKLTLQFMLEFNRRLLSAIEAPYLSKLNSKKRTLLQENGISKLLSADSEPDCENGLDFSNKMLTFYQEVSQNIKNDPLKEYHEDLRSSLFFYKPAAIVSISLSAVFLFLSRFYGIQEEGRFEINTDFIFWYLMTAPFAAYFFASFLMISQNLTYSKNALENLQCFAEQEIYTLPGTNHAESVNNIKGWFEDRNVFFHHQSMAKMVDDNIVKLSSGI